MQGEGVRRGLHRSLRIWTLYVDLEESLGTFESVRAVYDRILDLRIATPQIIINYAMYLEENKYFEEAFKVRAHDPHDARLVSCLIGENVFVCANDAPRLLAVQVYERGIGLFAWPFVFDVYIIYINKFIARYVCAERCTSERGQVFPGQGCM
jgi:pre-mRNA-splicing factor SYF1